MTRLLTLSVLFTTLTACGLTGGDADVAPAPAPDHGKATITPGPSPGSTPDEGTDADAPITADDCEQAEAGEPLPEGEWLTGKLSCGDEVVGHTGGGGQWFNTRFYEHNQCTPATTNHDGGNERVYQLTVPDGDRSVTVTLDTPCGDLDLAAFKYDGSSVPAPTASFSRCEMNIKGGTTQEHVKLVSRNKTVWTVVVEGKDGEALPYALRVACKDGLN